MDVKKIAIDYFNKTWELIDNVDRNPSESLKMIDYAMKSKYSWMKVGTKLNLVRADWLISRALTEAGILEGALLYAKDCLEMTLREGFKDFDLFFAYECFVRIYHLEHDDEKRDKLIQKAKEALHTIEKEEDKDYCQKELNKILAMER